METQVLAGRYRLERQLGKGGMGSVWLAEHLALNSWVAVKLMDPSIAATVEGAERFRREAQAAASLRSAHVVQVLDYGVHDSTPFLVMELLQGESLADCLERERKLSPARALSIVTQVARAIGRAHAAGIVHRDLKPDNIFLVREDDQELAKVLDFGIAKTTGHRLGGMETRTGVTMGTPYYMSPEQLEGKKELDHRSDLWSLSVIACECLSGARPFDGETYGELLLNICARPIVPPSQLGCSLPGFDEWFLRGANRDPEQRFSSAQELASSLADVVAGRYRSALAASAMAPRHGGPGATLPLSDSQLGPQIAAAAITATAAPAEASKPRRSSGLLLALVLALSLVATGALIVLLVSRRAQRTTESSAPESSGAPRASNVAHAPEVQPGPPALPSALDATAAGATARGSIAPPSDANEEKLHAGHAASLAPSSPARPSAIASTVRPSPSSRAVRCYSDPFTGQLRLADAAHASSSFSCTQNPFTGAFQRK